MKFHYLVDYENINEAGIAGLEHLGSEDTVYLFYTRNANKISFDFVSALLEKKIPAQLRIFRVSNGKQSLDFQLLAYLGFLIGSETDSENFYLVVSKDGGFNHAVTFLRQHKLCERVRMVPSIESFLQEKKRSSCKNAAAEMPSGAVPEDSQAEAVEAPSPREEEAPAAIAPSSEETVLSGDQPVARPAEEAPAVPDAGEVIPEKEGNRTAPSEESGEAGTREESGSDEPTEDLPAGEQEPVEDASEKEPVTEPVSNPADGEMPIGEERSASQSAVLPEEKPVVLPGEANAAKKPEERKAPSGRRRGGKKAPQTPSGEAAAPAAGTPTASPAPEVLSAAAKKKLASERRAQINQAVQKILSKAKIEGDTISFVSSTVVKYFAEENGKQRIYREIVKKCGRQEGLSLYRLIRGELE